MPSDIVIDEELRSDKEIEAPQDRLSASNDSTERQQGPGSSGGGTDLVTGPPDELEWDSPDDPSNARNWSMKKKIFHTAIPALYGFVM
jgi:hypothetical protein